MNSIILALSVLLAVSMVAGTPTFQAFMGHNHHMLMVEEPDIDLETPTSSDHQDAMTSDELTDATGSLVERSDRHRRATCDLLSISLPWGSLNHSACAAHCIAMRKGFRGGRCKDGVCHCRK